MSAHKITKADNMSDKYRYFLIYKHIKFFIKEMPKYQNCFVSYVEVVHAFTLSRVL